MQSFKTIIIGAGMMGAAAAKYLAGDLDGVALVGPGEPENKSEHQGVFASHYDEGRITRTIDPDAVWARLANRSIARYGAIEAASGVTFYTQAGCLITGPQRGGSDGYIDRVVQAADQLKARVNVLGPAGLADTFPFFQFPPATDGVFEPANAGHVSPRKLVKAQCILADKAGATIIRQEAVSVDDRGDHVVVRLVDGVELKADNVLVAAGGFTNGQNLLPQKLDLLVLARTIVYFEVSEKEAARLQAMPSLITKPENEVDSIYMLPPIRYPDGKIYLKIGGDPTDIPVTSDADMRAWFRTDGTPSAREHLVKRMMELVPDLKVETISSGSCVTSYSKSTYPMIGFSSSPRIAVMAGCGGASAKSSDEIGRLGAQLMLHGRIADPAYATDFAPEFIAS